jgi:phthiocerol/phenolphthiocerol synthesis type-I polyketide synthase E
VERQGDSPAALTLAPVSLTGTPTEQALATLWRDLLKLPAVDHRRTFFEHGGNSLLAAQLIFRIRRAFGVTLPLRAVFEAPGLAAMARRIDGYAGQITAPQSENDAAGHSPMTLDGLPINLPNGLAILCQNQPEVGHFYQDIFVDRVYVSHGVTLPAGAVVFDVGANIGLFSLFAHLEAPGARLYSFEPAPPLFGLLQANLERHGVAATVYPCALSSRPGTAELTFYPKSTGMSSLYADLDEEKAVLETVLRNQVRRGESELEPLLAHVGDYLAERFKEEHFTCRLRTLPEVIAEAGVDRIDLLKIDVQKAELDVLLGLDDRNWPKVRQVVVEVHDIHGRLARMRGMLEERGFHVESDQEALYAGSPIYLLYGTRDNGV